MPINNSIIFYLDNIFLVYRVGLVNKSNSTGESNLDSIELEQIESIEGDGKYLELAQNFEVFMDYFANTYDIKSMKTFFLISSRAGFTDSRVVFTWLKTNKMFNQDSDFFVTKVTRNPAEMTGDRLHEILVNAVENDQKSLLYSKEPNIGKK